MNRLLFEACLAFLALPGIVAFLIPLVLYAPARRRGFDAYALALVLPAIALLMWCVVEFYRSGKGTLAPWTPPKHLVVSGPYAWSRNPMYVAVTLILWGWALGFRSTQLSWYAAGMMVVFFVRVTLFEEPWLAETHRDAWQRYRAQVARWVGPRTARAVKAHET